MLGIISKSKNKSKQDSNKAKVRVHLSSSMFLQNTEVKRGDRLMQDVQHVNF